MEIERKFVLEAVPDGLGPGSAIEQGYLAIDPAAPRSACAARAARR